jgi:exodeoxyribonuclease V
VMCTFNQHGKGFMNGEQGIVKAFHELPHTDMKEGETELMQLMEIKSLTTGKDKMVKFNPLSFDADEETAKEAQKAEGGFTFGYCCTVHKSQGSEWDKVLFIQEPMGDISKLYYTAYTRAAANLCIYRQKATR